MSNDTNDKGPSEYDVTGEVSLFKRIPQQLLSILFFSIQYKVVFLAWQV